LRGKGKGGLKTSIRGVGRRKREKGEKKAGKGEEKSDRIRIL